MFEAFSRYQYPNLAAEIQTHRVCLRSFADHGNITVELLKAFLDGRENITPQEACGMVRLSNGGENIPLSPQYMLAPKFAYYDTRNPKHRRKVMEALRRCDEVRQTVDIRQLCREGKIYPYKRDYLLKEAKEIFTMEEAAKYRYIGRVLVNQALRFVADIEQAKKRRIELKPRGLTNKSAELTA